MPPEEKAASQDGINRAFYSTVCGARVEMVVSAPRNSEHPKGRRVSHVAVIPGKKAVIALI